MGNRAAKAEEHAELRCKLLLVGEHKAGKTTLVKTYKRLLEGFSEEFSFDASCNLVFVKDAYRGTQVKVLCMDSFNIEDFSLECRARSIKNANLCLLVFDASDPEKFAMVSQQVELLIKHNYSKTLLVLGTKSDLSCAVQADVEAFMAEQHLIPIEYYAVSGLTGEGVGEVFQRALGLTMAKYSSRWVMCRGLLLVYSHMHIEFYESHAVSHRTLANLCEAIPQILKRKKNKVRCFPLHRLSLKLLQQTAEFL